jgi:DNA (cytosine-5)-methyltransferase 1
MKQVPDSKTRNKGYRRKWPTVVDLYSGCGMVTAGLKKRHFRIVAAVDNDPVACHTYQMNHPSTLLIEEDIRRVDPNNILRDALDNNQLDVLIVCAPCQPFSNQNRYKGEDNRERLILESVRFAGILKPKIILFENVPGLVGKRFCPILAELVSDLERLGYTCGKPTRINAADFNVPQRRHRCVLLASYGKKLPVLPSSVTPVDKRYTVAEALQGLVRLQSGQADDNDPLHFARNHNPIALKRLFHIPKNGGDRFSLPPHLELNCHKDNKGYPDVYGRMKWEDVAPTLTTGCTDITRGRFAHPEDDRAITLREAARLQTFPDNYKFDGNSSQIATQIGNAVPMKLVEALAPALRCALRHRSSAGNN